MSLTRKIGAYLCTAAMVFSLNFKSDAIFKEIIQGPGIFLETLLGCFFAMGKSTTNKENVKENVKVNENDMRILRIAGWIFLFDALQRTYYLVFDDGNSKAEKTDNKEVNKKNEKKDLNA